MVPLARSWEGREEENICKYVAFEVPQSKTGVSQMALEVKNPPANAGDISGVGSTPGSERSPGGGNSNPLQYSCLEN